MKTGFIFHHLLVLAQSYFELKMDAPSQEFAPSVHCGAPVNSCRNASFCSIPVRVPNSNVELMTLVSPEDYERLIAITPVWRVCTSGYVVSSKRVDKIPVTKFMHKEILGMTGRHINGDKLDNRRCNLQVSQSRHKKKLSEADLLKTVAPLLDHTYSFIDCPDESTYCTIDYENGMVYQGEIHAGRPHGFGSLIEKDNNKTSLGWWIQGDFKSGIIMFLAPIPDIIRQQGFMPQIKQAILVVNSVKIDVSVK